LLRDLIASQPDRTHHVVVTDLHGHTKREAIARLFAMENVSLEYAAGESWADAFQLVRRALGGRPEARVFLLTHQEDAPAVAAAMASGHQRLHFVHHADYSLSLGMHFPEAVHVDLTNHSYHNCRGLLAPAAQRYVPLSSAEISPRDPAEFRFTATDTEFLTCSAGAGLKFQLPYDYSYLEMIPELLARSAGRHVHIGPLPEAALDGWAAALRQRGIAPERLRHVPRVDDIAAAMGTLGVSLYLSSWPLGGAKTMIDVQSSGTPILAHRSYRHAYFGTQCLLHPGGLVWDTPEQFFRIIADTGTAALQNLASQGRRHWERHHRPAVLKQFLTPEPLLDAPPEPPPDSPVNALRKALALLEISPAEESLAAPLAAAEERCRKLERSLAKNSAALEKCRRSVERRGRESEEIKKSLTWKAARFFFRQERTLRNWLGRRRKPPDGDSASSGRP
jgi:hypothetical protein